MSLATSIITVIMITSTAASIDLNATFADIIAHKIIAFSVVESNEKCP